MAKDEVQFGYALLDDTKHIVNINGIDRTYTRIHKFYCPHCHNEMYATFGEIQRPHFRHNGDKCRYSNYLHDLAERVFYEEYSICLEKGYPFYLVAYFPLPCNKACVLEEHADCKEHYVEKKVDLTKEYTLISLESRVDINGHYRRPDILLESLDGKQLWVEIWVSHETENEKRKDGRIIEIKINTEKDLEKIQQHSIVQSEREDRSVRIFNIETNELCGLTKGVQPKSDINIKFPCEDYYCFEIGPRGENGEVIDYIRTIKSPNLLYRVVLRLNWRGTHNSAEGSTGVQISENHLKEVCSNGILQHYKSLIVSEWKATFSNPETVQSSLPVPQPTPVSVDISNIEWVDLGLPSGTIWAKKDVDCIMSFYNARIKFGSRLPSRKNAMELDKYCTKRWDAKVCALILTGPNGNSISFPCEGKAKHYWLKEYEDKRHAKSFYISPEEPGRFVINKSDVHLRIYVRLVST